MFFQFILYLPIQCYFYKMWISVWILEVVHKRRPHKIAKYWTPPPCPQNVHTDLTPTCPCGHTINFEKSYVCSKKCGRSHLKYPLIRKIFAPLSQLENIPRWDKNILRVVEGGKRALGEEYTKYNKINNNSENFRGGKIAARGASSPCPP